MTGDDPYNEAVRRYFESPVHAGTLDGNYDEVLVSDASESGNAVRVVLCAGLKDGKIASIRFRARGCPHLVAATELICGDLEGTDRGELTDLVVLERLDKLEIPVTKRGRMLLIADAAKGLK